MEKKTQRLQLTMDRKSFDQLKRIADQKAEGNVSRLVRDWIRADAKKLRIP
jgi:hypothetical protein